MWNKFSMKRQSKSLAAQLRDNVNVVGNVNAGGNGVNYCDDEEESSSSSGSDDSSLCDVPAAPNATNHRTNNDSNDDDDDDSVVQQQVQVQQQRIYNKQRLDACTLFFSDLSFFFGSTMYLWLVVSLYMMYGFIASLLFCVTGLFKMCLATNNHWCDRLPYLFMVLASILGMISSSIIRLYPFISNILFCIEIHLFALQAATLVLGRFKTVTPNIVTTTTTTPSDGEHLTTITISTKFPWIRFIGGDILFLIATLTGIAVSYLYLFDYIIIGDDYNNENENDNDDYNDTISLYLSIISAGLWWLSSIMYLMETFFNKLLGCQSRRPTSSRNDDEDDDDDNDDSDDDDKNHHESNVNKGLVQDNTEITKEEEEDVDNIDHENQSSKSSNIFRFTRNSNRKTTATTTTNNIYNNQNNYNNNVKDDDDDDDDTGSVISSWTVGPGPKNKEHITKSSLDDIFGRPVHRTKANMTYY